MAWNKRSTQCAGAVFFRAAMTPQVREFGYLSLLDIIAKSESPVDSEPDLLTSRCHDFARALAFAIVEGKVQAATPLVTISSAGPLRLVSVDEFNRRANKADRQLRDLDDAHNKNRTVLCDPAGSRWIDRLTGSKAHSSRGCPHRRAISSLIFRPPQRD
jgi:hypothetical protein